MKAYPQVQLQLAGIGFWDARPCAVGNGTYISSYDVGNYAPIGIGGVPPSGLSICLSCRPLLTYNRLQMGTTPFWVDYCPMVGPCGKCSVSLDGPQGACIVATLIVK